MVPVPQDLITARLARLRLALARDNLDAFVVGHPPNLFYLTGLASSAGIAVVDAAQVSVIVDFRYAAAARDLPAAAQGGPAADVVQVETSYEQTLAGLLRDRGYERVGIEAAHMSLARGLWLADALGATLAGGPLVGQAGPSLARPVLVPSDRMVERLRLLKDAHEIAVLREAGRRLADVAREVLGRVAPGRSERDVAADIDFAIRRSGFTRPAFETIVASGPNSARPHGRPTDRMLAEGDVVVLDFGGVYDGYCVDLTRTVCLGAPGHEVRQAHMAVAAAQAAALAAARPGARASTVDAAARDTLAAHGLADYFGHGTGHGLGLEVHEEPRISRAAASGDHVVDEVLAPGMVFTIEPGVYLEGRWGLRVEDDVLLTEAGHEILTPVGRDLLVIGPAGPAGDR